MESHENEMKDLIKKEYPFMKITPDYFALLHEVLLFIKSNGRDLDDEGIPEEVQKNFTNFKMSNQIHEAVAKTITLVAKSQPTKERISDLFKNTSKSSFSERFQNVIGWNDDVIGKPNMLGENLLNTVGGDVKESSITYGTGGPISDKTIDMAIKESKQLFYDLQTPAIQPSEMKETVYEEFIAQKHREDSELKRKESIMKAKVKDELEKNKKLTPEEILELQRKEMDRQKWPAPHPFHYLHKVVERHFEEDDNIRNSLLRVVSDDKNNNAGKIIKNFNRVRSNFELGTIDKEFIKYNEEILYEMAVGNLENIMKSCASSGKKTELLSIIATKLVRETQDNCKALIDLLATRGDYGTSFISPLADILLENTKSIEDLVKDELKNTEVFSNSELSDMMDIANNKSKNTKKENNSQSTESNLYKLNHAAMNM